MGLKATDTCLQKAGDDEPIFVLRAKDKSMTAVVQYWIDMNASTLRAEKREEAEGLIKLAEKWAADNGSKWPD